jgi:hypothetical protein
MKIKTITYQRVKNLGNYESERLEMTAELDPSEDDEVAIAELKARVEISLNITSSEPTAPF